MNDSYDLVIIGGGSVGLTAAGFAIQLPPDDVQNLRAWVACVAGAGTPEDYVVALRKAGFTHFTVEDHQDALLKMVEDVRRKLLGVELAVGLCRNSGGLGKLDLGDGSTELAEVLDLREGKRLARRAVELIEGGTVGYTLIAARKR